MRCSVLSGTRHQGRRQASRRYLLQPLGLGDHQALLAALSANPEKRFRFPQSITRPRPFSLLPLNTFNTNLSSLSELLRAFQNWLLLATWEASALGVPCHIFPGQVPQGVEGVEGVFTRAKNSMSKSVESTQQVRVYFSTGLLHPTEFHFQRQKSNDRTWNGVLGTCEHTLLNHMVFASSRVTSTASLVGRPPDVDPSKFSHSSASVM